MKTTQKFYLDQKEISLHQIEYPNQNKLVYDLCKMREYMRLYLFHEYHGY
ncbi:MAG: hypothetical protein IPO78_16600 [Saprospiraceae bacterium]|nr:hypothetical protein [Saprospiraceae bacterium]MBK9723200.1 hypothetical protein [Saprospiraceae bacterium]